MMSAPLLIAAASCVPAAAVNIKGPASPSAVRVAPVAPETPEWAKLDPGMPYRLLEPEIVPARPFAEEAKTEEDKLRSLDCLAQAVYYEARSESEDGQRAVAQVVLNRVRHPAYPNNICGVVYQGSQLRTGCQFTFTCDGSLRYQPNAFAWARAQRLAAEALAGEVYGPVGTATHYHTTAISPYWAPKLTRTAVVGAHVFYRMPGTLGAPNAFSQNYAGWEPTAARAAKEYEPVPAVLASAAEVEAGVRKWRGISFSGVRIHRGSDAAAALPADAAASATAAPAAVPPAIAEAADEGSHGVKIHRGSDDGLPASAES